MAQHSIMSILLFVCLSLCFEVAQSQFRKNGDICYTNAECESGCCFMSRYNYRAAECRPKGESRECVGLDDGDFCFRSPECDSGCCRLPRIRIVPPRRTCEPRGTENATCSLAGFFSPFIDCPCENGLVCQRGQGDQTGRPTCKKPDTANNGI